MTGTTETTVSLSWTESPETDVVTYNIYRDGGLIDTVSDPTTTYTDTGLTLGTSYDYQVSAVDGVPQEGLLWQGQEGALRARPECPRTRTDRYHSW